MNIMIDGKWINLDNVVTVVIVKLYEMASDECRDEYRETLRIGGTDTGDWIDIPMTAPGAKSAWAWLQKAAIVFDAESDAELEPVIDDSTSIVDYAASHQKPSYDRGDSIVFRNKMTGIVNTGKVVRQIDEDRYGVDNYVRQTHSMEIIGLAPPESKDHE